MKVKHGCIYCGVVDSPKLRVVAVLDDNGVCRHYQCWACMMARCEADEGEYLEVNPGRHRVCIIQDTWHLAK